MSLKYEPWPFKQRSDRVTVLLPLVLLKACCENKIRVYVWLNIGEDTLFHHPIND